MITKRFWELDFLRGLAILMMIAFHILSDLNFLGNYDINLYSGFWFYFGRATASIFLVLIGVSLTISYSKPDKSFNKFLKRGLKVFFYGLIISVLTYLFVREAFVRFGILHLIGVSIILAYPFIRFKYINLLIGLIFVILGIYLWDKVFDFSWLLWLGFTPNKFYTLDYYPLLPWFGVVLIGIFLGNLLYKDGIRRFRFVDLSGHYFVKVFSFLGRHSLIIYLVHQPILILLLYLLGLISLPL